MQLRCSSALSEGAALPLTLSRRSHGMSAARTLSGSGNQNTREIWCRRRESNDTRLLILRNLLQTYERKNRTTRCMPASYVQNHVQQIGRGSLFNTVSDASGYSVRTGGFARYRDLSSQVSPRATIFRVTKERWAQIGITTEFLIVARTLSEFFRLRHAFGTNFISIARRRRLSF